MPVIPMVDPVTGQRLTVKQWREAQQKADYAVAKANGFVKPRGESRADSAAKAYTPEEVHGIGETNRAREGEIRRNLPKEPLADRKTMNFATEILDADIRTFRTPGAKRVLKKLESAREKQLAAKQAEAEATAKRMADPKTVLAIRMAEGWVKLATASGNESLIEQATEALEIARDARSPELSARKAAAVSEAIQKFWDEQRANAVTEKLRATQALIDADEAIRMAENASSETPPAEETQE